jgi:hypothetical protein
MLNSPIVAAFGAPLLSSKGVLMRGAMLQHPDMPLTFTRGTTTGNATFVLARGEADCRRTCIRVDGLEAWSHRSKFGVHEASAGAAVGPGRGAVFLGISYQAQPGGEPVPRAVPGLAAVKPVLGGSVTMSADCCVAFVFRP